MSNTYKQINATTTIKNLDKRIKTWISDLVSTPTPRELFLDEPMNAFTTYLNGQDISHTLGDQSENLATWYLINYENTVFNGNPNYEDLAYTSFHYGQMLEIKNHWLIVIAGGLCYLLYQHSHFHWRQSLIGRTNVLHALTYLKQV